MLCVLCGVCGFCSGVKIKNRWLGFGFSLVRVRFLFGFCLVRFRRRGGADGLRW